MKASTKAGIIKLNRVRASKTAELVQLVKDGSLSVDEAAQSLAGAQLKVFDEFGGRDYPGFHDDLLSTSKVDITSRL